MPAPRSEPIPYFCHRVETKRGLLTVWSFSARPGTVPDGYLIGPEGTMLVQNGPDLPKLRVPKPERPGEYFYLNAADAARCAGSGRYRLELAATPRGTP